MKVFHKLFFHFRLDQQGLGLDSRVWNNIRNVFLPSKKPARKATKNVCPGQTLENVTSR